MKNKYLIVISFDAVSSEDLNKLKELPNFSKVIKEAAMITSVESIYPSLTYPVHATIITGKYPVKHGIVNNTKLKIGENNPDWYWYSKSVKGNTLYDIAAKDGLSTAAILWPVTGRANIKFNMPEICCTKPWHNQIFRSAFAGTLSYQLKMNKRYGHLRCGIKQPYLDNFAMEVAKDTILEEKPNLLLLHLVDVDSQKHYFGTKSKEVEDALIRHDKRLGEIIDTLKKANIFEASTMILLGDHSQIDVNKVVRLNNLFYKNGLISLNKNGKIKNYKVIAKSCDGSSYIYIKDKNNNELRERVRQILINEAKKNKDILEKVFSKEEAINLGADSNCDFIVEAKDGNYFIDEILGEFVEDVNEVEIGSVDHRAKAMHGYLPTKDNYSTFFIAYGKGIKKGVVIEKGDLINHGPTLAKILGVDLGQVDGRVEKRIFEE